jgi:beta-glucanase (GH16 family)
VAFLFLAQSATAQNWTLVWSDEFNGPAGSAPDPSIWKFETGNNNGWGNNELEYYCPPTNNTPPCSTATPNIYMDGTGNLVIKAINQSGTWTSGRMKTEGLESFQYGRIEARMKLPVGAGIWPAFWMLGTNIGSAGWPTCGEQDIMEWVPKYTPTTTSSTIHGPGYSGGNGIGSKFTFPSGGRVDNAFHTYGVIWSQNKMQFYRDDYTQPFFTVTPANIPGGTQWVYNHPFFILLNLAMGGGFPGNPDGTTPNPAMVLVDYVRVYEQSPTVTVTSSNNPSVFGQPVTLTATLSPASATGTVQFLDGVTNLGSPVTVSGGTAAMIVSSLSVGAHSITAVYSGDSNFAGSTSPALSQNVNQASSATATTSNNNPSAFGQAVTFTATVSAVPPGSGTPTGTVQFKDGVTNLGSPVTLSSGTATSSSISSLTVGAHSITAVYSGDSNFAGSTSAPLTQSVTRTTSTTISNIVVFPNPTPGQKPGTVHMGQTITVTATVTTAAGTPTGSVALLDNNGIQVGSSVNLPNSGSTQIVSFGPLELGLGAHSIVAKYSGDGTFQASSSAPSLIEHIRKPR